MKVLVATTKTQGQRKNDFAWARPGELVTYGFECDRETVNGKCGCKRALVGVETRKATTTFVVEDRSDLTVDAIKDRLAKALAAGGWLKGDGSELDRRMLDASLMDWQTLQAQVAAACAVGTVVERRGNRFCRRREVAA